MKIYPLIGFDNVKFGYSRSEVSGILGEPTEKELIAFPDGVSADNWFYKETEVELNFDSDEQFRLTCITFSSRNAEIEGIKIIGKTEDDLKTLFPQVYLEEINIDLGSSYVYPEKEISFWIVKNSIKSFTIFVPLDLSGEKVQWPE